MDHDPAKVHEVLAALAAPSRFELLVLMLSGAERSVSQLAEAVGLSQSCTTRHLQALASAGLVKGARDGKRVVFRIAPRDAAARAVLASVTGGPGSESVSGRAGRATSSGRREPGEPDFLDGSRRFALARLRNRAPLAPGGPKAGRRPRTSRRSDHRSGGDIVATAIRIESAAELEPYSVGDADPGAVQVAGAQALPESGRTSEPEALPAWRRSDLDDFLL